MKIHLVQKTVGNNNLRPFLDRAVSDGADLICFGELSTTGCIYEPREVDSLEVHLEQLDQFDIAVMIGLPINTESGLTNNYVYHDREQTLIYNKINLFEPMNEPDVYIPGSSPGVFDTKFGKLGVAICYDLRFPEIFTDLKEAGAEKIFVPAAWPKVRIHHWQDRLVQRAKECQAPVLGINSIGDDGRFLFGGSSMAIDRDGSVLAQAGGTDEIVLKVEL